MTNIEPYPIITGVLDYGDRGFIGGPPKSGRSFLAAQLAVGIAAGHDTLEYRIPAPRRVAFLQYQSAPHHISRRLSGIASGMGIDSHTITDNFNLLNLRGVSTPAADLARGIATFKPDIVVIDSFEDAPDQLATVSDKIGCSLLAIRDDMNSAMREGDAALIITPTREYENVALDLATIVRHGRSPYKQHIDWERGYLVARDVLRGGRVCI